VTVDWGCRAPIKGLSEMGPTRVTDEYGYSAADCDVSPDRRSALDSYRAKRRLWLSWINSYEHHAIWTVLSEMVWNDVVFK
jgi:hypothetical protein